MHGLSRLLILLSFSAMAAGFLNACSLVDEDRDHCDGAFRLVCRLRLTTRVDAQLQEALGTDPADREIKDLLAQYLQPVFPEKSKDADLSFFEAAEPGNLVNHLVEPMDAGERVYSLVLPVASYRQLTLANLQACPALTVEGSNLHKQVALVQDNLERPQQAGVFTGRKAFEVKAGANEEVEVSLYMVNAATALVLDVSKAPSAQIRVTLEGMAAGFSVADSTYFFEAKAPEMGTDLLVTSDGKTRCYPSVHFPSAQPAPKAESAASWRWNVYVTLPDGQVTRTVFSMPHSLEAGSLAVLKAMVQDTGVVTTVDPSVGVSVTLNWHQGMDYFVEL